MWFRIKYYLWCMKWLAIGFILSIFLQNLFSYTEKASYYSSGIFTANGERYDPYSITVASWFYDFDTLLLITNPANGKSIVVRVNDRGPADWVMNEREIYIDLNYFVCWYLTDGKPATINIQVEEL